jgi:hypothetical protein
MPGVAMIAREWVSIDAACGDCGEVFAPAMGLAIALARSGGQCWPKATGEAGAKRR